MDDDLSREEKVTVMGAFFAKMSERERAEFAVNLQASVDGLQKNNAAYVKEFRKLYSEKLKNGHTGDDEAGREVEIRKQITQAKLKLTILINELEVAEWTDADVNIQYEIARDPDIRALLKPKLESA